VHGSEEEEASAKLFAEDNSYRICKSSLYDRKRFEQETGKDKYEEIFLIVSCETEKRK
jgi:hypothetical protein